MSEELVLTPGGYRPKSSVHLIEPGYEVRLKDNHVHKVDSSGQFVEDLGEIPLPPITWHFNPNWLAFTYYQWNTPLANLVPGVFKTTWIVPPPPVSRSGQFTIFLFNGINFPNSMILQPVLQWGGGGNNWSVCSMYAGPSGPGMHSTIVNVNPGQTLTGIIELTNQEVGLFTYLSVFDIDSRTALTATVGNAYQAFLCETLECYGITDCTTDFSPDQSTDNDGRNIY